MSSNSSGSSDADSMISVPQPSTRSSRLCSKRTLLIRDSGMSRPVRLRKPSRAITRSLVTMKCVVRQRTSGASVSQPTSTTPTTASAICAIDPHDCSDTSDAVKANAATTARRTNTGSSNIFQCGWLWITTCSLGLSRSSGYATAVLRVCGAKRSSHRTAGHRARTGPSACSSRGAEVNDITCGNRVVHAVVRAHHERAVHGDVVAGPDQFGPAAQLDPHPLPERRAALAVLVEQPGRAGVAAGGAPVDVHLAQVHQQA